MQGGEAEMLRLKLIFLPTLGHRCLTFYRVVPIDPREYYRVDSESKNYLRLIKKTCL